ncbi:MAG: GNAT family N-acetyltransferase [Granulosicoccus sp.]
MSRRSFSNHKELMAIVNQCREKAAHSAVRAFIVIELVPDSWLLSFSQDNSIPFIKSGSATDRSDRISAILGGEHECLIHSLSERFDLGLFAALAGTIRAGGVLIVAVPNTAHNTMRHRLHKIHSLLMQRYPDVFLREHFKTTANKAQPSELIGTQDQAVVPDRITVAPISLAEQDSLYAQSCEFLAQHKKGCILITGRRGRGKSMLVARLANWLHEQQRGYSITAANQSALTTIYQNCPTAREAFVSIETNKAANRILLIDEAGSLPVATLNHYLKSYDQVVFCTTVEGYEIAGRAFDVRFSAQLLASHKHVLALNAVEPWRWAKDDPLEVLVDQLLLTNQAALTNDLVCSVKPEAVSFNTQQPASGDSLVLHHSQKPKKLPGIGIARRIDQAELADNEHKLHSLFTLLRTTHYQTSTQDLEHLLDSPAMQIWVVESENAIDAVVLLTLEGGIESDVHEAIVSKKRRLRHHLLPQLLAQSANSPASLSYSFARIIRISVVGAKRRKGVASQLLSFIEAQLRNDKNPPVAMGASFASDCSSIAFWQHNGYVEFHRGFRQNPRTGKKAVAMVKTWDAKIEADVKTAVQIHSDNSHAGDQLSQHPTKDNGVSSKTDIAAAQSPESRRSDEARPYDHALLTRFAANQRSMQDTLGPLLRLAKRYDFSLPDHESLQDRKAFERTLRQSVADILTSKQ